MRVLVTGATGFLGKHVIPRLKEEQCGIADSFGRMSCDLRHEANASRLMFQEKPDTVIHLAASVGGIHANQRHPGSFFRDNILCGINVIHAAALHQVSRFVLVGSACCYPKHCHLPFQETSMWEGYPEETNGPYGVSKRALSVMLEAYGVEYGMSGVTVIPANLYGPHDCFDEDRSHVIPALIKKFLSATSSVDCWGNGSATRDFLYVEDAADAIVRAAFTDCEGLVNIGSENEISIGDVALKIADLCGYSGIMEWDQSMPNGQPRRRLCCDRARDKLGWSAKTGLDEGLAKTIAWAKSEVLITSTADRS